jgi:hypothetical protein
VLATPDLAPTDPPAVRIPAEAVARARDFRRRVEAEDDAWMAAIKSALRPVVERRERHPDRPLRYEHLAELSHGWKLRAPQRFRIAFTAHIERTRGTVTERRLGIGRLTDDIAEPGCSVVELRFTADRHGVHRTTAILAAFSLHAIATRFARGQAIDDAAIIGDMASVAAIDLDELGPAGGGVRIGGWRGRLGTVADADGSVRRLVRVGTWMES